MNIQEAYEKAKQVSDRKVLTECLDLGDMWAFNFRNDLLISTLLVGGVSYYTVNKKNGKVGAIGSSPDCIKFLEKGKPVNIKQFTKTTTKLEMFLGKLV